MVAERYLRVYNFRAIGPDACVNNYQERRKDKVEAENRFVVPSESVGIISFKELYPSLAEEWADDKELLDKITIGSHKKVLWCDSKGHRWYATVKNRVKGSGCPYCSGNTVLIGFNDLSSLNPLLASEWSVKNYPLMPSMVTVKSNKKVIWCCKQNHEWSARIADRNEGSGCPYCKGQKIWTGFNDLKTRYPELVCEWAQENRKRAEDISPLSRENVWWKCKKCGCRWKAVVYSRTHGSGCPKCKKIEIDNNRIAKTHEREMKASFNDKYIEIVLMYCLEHNSVEYELNNDGIIGIPIYCYMPKLKGAIEVFHYGEKLTKTKYKYDIVENDLCRKAGIKLIRIMPRKSKPYDDCLCIKQNGDHHIGACDAVIRSLKAVGIKYEVEPKKDDMTIFKWYAEKQERGVFVINGKS